MAELPLAKMTAFPALPVLKVPASPRLPPPIPAPSLPVAVTVPPWMVTLPAFWFWLPPMAALKLVAEASSVPVPPDWP